MSVVTGSLIFCFCVFCAYVVLHELSNLSVILEYPLPFPLSLLSAQRRTFATSASSARVVPYPSDLVALTNRLVSIPSVTGAEDPAFAYVARWARFHGLHYESRSVPPLAAGLSARRNLLISCAPGVNPRSAQVVLVTHLDTVAAIPTTLIVPNDSRRIYGRGSVDAKGLAAAMLLTLSDLCAETEKLAPSNNLHSSSGVAVAMVCGEENGHDGMRRLHEFGLPPDVSFVNGEPTKSTPVVQQKGMLKVLLSAHGRAAHSGYPHLGDCAVRHMFAVLNELAKRFAHAASETENANRDTVNFGQVAGGAPDALNVVPHSANATLIFRVATSAANVEANVRDVVARVGNGTVEMRVAGAHVDPIPLHVPPRFHKIMGGDTIKVAYNTDLPYYQGKFKHMVLFGAGSIEQAHTDGEFVDIEELSKLPRLYRLIVDELFEGYVDKAHERDAEGADEKQAKSEDEGMTHDEV